MGSPFKGIDGKQATRDSEYMRAGRYLAYINEFKTGENRNNVPNVRFATTILAVLDDTNAVKDPKGAHAVGHKASWVMSFAKDNTMPNLKAAVMAITGVPEEEVDQEFCDNLTSSEQPLQGMVVEFDNDIIKYTPKNGASDQPSLFTQVKIRRRWSKAEVLEHVEEAVFERLGLSTDNIDD